MDGDFGFCHLAHRRKPRVKPLLRSTHTLTLTHSYTLATLFHTYTHTQHSQQMCPMLYCRPWLYVTSKQTLRIGIPASALNPAAPVSDPRQSSPSCLAYSPPSSVQPLQTHGHVCTHCSCQQTFAGSRTLWCMSTVLLKRGLCVLI